MADVAELAGVAVPTVSRVVNGSAPVREETERRVRAAIAQLGYEPNRTARGFSRGRVHTVACLVPFVTSPSAVQRVRGALAELRGSDFPMSLLDVEVPEHLGQHVDALTRHHPPEGVISVSIPWSSELLQRFRDVNVPVVAIDSRHDEVSCVVGDDTGGGAQATGHLLDLGHRRIGFIGDADAGFGFTSTLARLEGHRRELSGAGVATDGVLVRRGPHGRDEAAAMAAELLDLPDPPTAVFAASDTQALGVLAAARGRGLSVPADLSVVGYDDVDVAELVGLTTVGQQLDASGRHGVRLLMDHVADRDVDPVRVVLPPHLQVRRTTAPPARPDA